VKTATLADGVGLRNTPNTSRSSTGSKEGQAFAIAQTRLGGGRIHHAMRTIALARRAFDMMCERAVSRQTRFGRLADFQMTQERSPTAGFRLSSSACWCCEPLG
jgi:alkylation response protein AidB-like acyl-CoA dehydrogenase